MATINPHSLENVYTRIMRQDNLSLDIESIYRFNEGFKKFTTIKELSLSGNMNLAKLFFKIILSITENLKSPS